ncbi:MAG TPA: hypothetical protein EYN03_10370, partial [Planctomycetes bacterium]|nr:hypothetical protein [Planctomycetota bacterium]
MTQPQKNTALVFAIVAGLVSLPMTWMTLQGAEIQGGLGEIFNSALGEISLVVTGLNGSITFLFKTPIWFIVVIAIAASVLQLMQDSETFSIPRPAQWATAIVALAWIGLAIVMALFSGKATLGMGALLGLFSGVVPVVCLAIASPDEQAARSDPGETNESDEPGEPD